MPQNQSNPDNEEAIASWNEGYDFAMARLNGYAHRHQQAYKWNWSTKAKALAMKHFHGQHTPPSWEAGVHFTTEEHTLCLFRIESIEDGEITIQRLFDHKGDEATTNPTTMFLESWKNYVMAPHRVVVETQWLGVE